MPHPRTIAQIIDSVGVSALARALGHENVSTVSSWKLRGSIPVEHWPRLIEIARSASQQEITYSDLVAACAARKSETAA